MQKHTLTRSKQTDYCDFIVLKFPASILKCPQSFHVFSLHALQTYMQITIHQTDPEIFTEDTLPSGSSEGSFMKVQVLLPAPNSTNPNPRPIGEGFGFVVYFDYPNFNLKQKYKNEVGGQENDSEHR